MLVRASIRFELGCVIDDKALKDIQITADAAARVAQKRLQELGVSTGTTIPDDFYGYAHVEVDYPATFGVR